MSEKAPDYWQYAGAKNSFFQIINTSKYHLRVDDSGIPTPGTETSGVKVPSSTHLSFYLFDAFLVSPTERFYNFMSSYYFLAALLLILIVLEIVTSIALPSSPGQIVVIVLLAISIAGIAVYLSTFHLNACEG